MAVVGIRVRADNYHENQDEQRMLTIRNRLGNYGARLVNENILCCACVESMHVGGRTALHSRGSKADDATEVQYGNSSEVKMKEPSKSCDCDSSSRIILKSSDTEKTTSRRPMMIQQRRRPRQHSGSCSGGHPSQSPLSGSAPRCARCKGQVNCTPTC